MTKTLASRFTQATDTERHFRDIERICGETGTGKTHYTLTAPSPQLLQSLDIGTEGVIEPFIEAGQEIYLEEYDWTPGSHRYNSDRRSAIPGY